MSLEGAPCIKSKSKINDDLMRYLSGERVDFSKYRVDLQHLTPFQQAVLNEARKIPYGETITYSQLAERVGHPGATRAVGNALAKNPAPLIIPCHRIVTKNGPSGFSFCPKVKERLLSLESLSWRVSSTSARRRSP
ncbi:MAG: methylated-DNA--[protein]-cysteine S-methyltransferase [Methanosarcinales archaeon]|nr:MAG: methylated-DNA--[protein]-cysteine S-methyltransferase [Methanosarcinales archaeon]